MIVSDTSKWFKWLFGKYNEHYLLKRHFHTIQMNGDIDSVPQGTPVLYVMNHSSWWDGMIVYQAILRASSREHYMMMDEQQLARYRFFRKIGAFSIDKTSHRGMLASLRYSENLLSQGHSVWLFPQGDIQHLEHRPLRFQSGAGYLLQRCPSAWVQPVSVYYSFGLHQKAEVSLRFGEPLQEAWSQLGRRSITEMLELIIENQLNHHRKEVIGASGARTAGDRSLLKASRSTSEAFDAWKSGVARWTSFFGR